MSKKAGFWGALVFLLLTQFALSASADPTVDKLNDWLKKIFVPSAASPLGWSDLQMRKLAWDSAANRGQGGFVVQVDTKLYLADGVLRFTGQENLTASLDLVFSPMGTGGTDIEMSQKLRFKGDMLRLTDRVIAGITALLGTRPPEVPDASQFTRFEDWLKTLTVQFDQLLRDRIQQSAPPPFAAMAMNSFLQDWASKKGRLPFDFTTCVPAASSDIKTYQSCLEASVTETELVMEYLARGIDPSPTQLDAARLAAVQVPNGLFIAQAVDQLIQDASLTAILRELAGLLIDNVTHLTLGDPATLPSVDGMWMVKANNCLLEIWKKTIVAPTP